MDNLDNTLHFSEGEVSIQKGSSNLNYKYEPSTNARGRTVAFEYAFHNPMPNVTQAISLKSIDNTGVTLSYAYSTSKLTSITSSNTKFETQEVAPDGSRYIYILVTLSIAMPTDFQSKVVWNQGLLGSATIHDMDGNTYTTKIVKGQELKDYLAPSSITLNAYGAEWYSDAEYENTLTTTQGGDVYLRVPNLPTDYLGYTDSTNTEYQVIKGTSAVPNNLVIPAYYNGKRVVEIVSATTQNGVFYNKSNMVSVDFPNTMTSIGRYSFQTCRKLAVVNFSNSITTIKSAAFQSCGIQNLYIPKSLVTIEGAFSGCGEWFKTITVESGNTKYDSRNNCNALIETSSNKLLYGCNNTVVPTNVVTINDYAFYDANLTSIDLSACTSLTSINASAFRSCAYMTSIKLPNSLQTIGSYAFSDCTSLSTVNWQNCTSLTTIETDAFVSCYELTSIYIPQKVTSISERSFRICRGVTSIQVDSANTKYDSRNNCNAIMITATDALLKGCNSTIIPIETVSIKGYAFDNCSSLAHIDFTQLTNLTYIGLYAFSGCGNATGETLDLSKCTKLTWIENGAFYHCTKLKSVIIPSSVNKIGYYVFVGCNYITSITIEGATSTNWYVTEEYYTGGSVINLTNTTTNVTYFVNTYIGYYFYKK